MHEMERKRELKTLKEEYNSIIEQINNISKKLENIQEYEHLTERYARHIAVQIILTLLLTTIVIMAPSLLMNSEKIVSKTSELVKWMEILLNTYAFTVSGAVVYYNALNLKKMKEIKKQVQKIETPKESKKELEKEKERMNKQLEQNQKTTEETLEYIKLIEQMEKSPMTLVDSREEFLQMKETVEKGNLILENMKDERIDYKNIELKPDGTKQDIHRNCGKKLVKVYK